MNPRKSACAGHRPPEHAEPRRVLIVDDSSTNRGLLRWALAGDRRLEIVGEAVDAFEARRLIKALAPDVLTLDVEMPRMNGFDFLERLMRLRPMPVVVVSNRTRERSAEAVRALFLGAVDCMEIARLPGEPRYRARLADTLFLASATGSARRRSTARPPPAFALDAFVWNGRIVLIGSSTGGVDALERLLSRFPANGPPAVIAQHMPGAYLRSFSQRLNDLVAPAVRIAEDGCPVLQGEVLIGPGGGRHICLAAEAAGPRVTLAPAAGSDLHVPSVDRLFGSAIALGPRVAAAVLTGMGRDGAVPLAALKRAGARIFAQSADSAVVDGMPGAARETGTVERAAAPEVLGDLLVAAASAAPGPGRSETP